MSWYRESLAKAMMFEAEGTAGAPAATLDSGTAEPGSNGDVPEPKAGEPAGKELQAPDWMSSVPKEFRDDKALWKHSDISSYFKESLENSQKLEGLDPEKVLTIPGDDTGNEDRETFYQRLGKPKTAEGYELDDPAFPDGLLRDTELEGHLKQWAFKANMSSDALKELVGEYNKHMAEGYTVARAEYEKDLEAQSKALKTELGDGYNEFVTKAQRAAEKLGGEEFLNLLKDYGGLEKEPLFIKVFGEMGKMMSDDSALGGGPGSGGGEEVKLGFDGKPRITYKSDKPKQE